MNSSKLALTISGVVALHLIAGTVILLQPGCKSDSGTTAAPPPAAANSTATAANPPPLAEPTRPADVTPATPVPMGNLSSSEPLTGNEPAASPVSSGPTVTYEVKKGDSLSKIAKEEKVSLTDLMAANNLTRSSKLKVGQSLAIPVSSGAAPAATGSAAPPPSPTSAPASSGSAGGTYTVKTGDSLSRIAHKNGTTVAALRAANHLTSDQLKVGQTLTLPAGGTASTTALAGTAPSPSEPAAPATGDASGVYVVKSGDSIDTIAKKTGVKASELISLNGIKNPRNLHIGQKLKLPTGAAATPSSAATPAPSAPTPPPSVTETATPPATPAPETVAPAGNGTVNENVPVTPVSN